MSKLLDLSIREVSANNVRGRFAEIIKPPSMPHHYVPQLQCRRFSVTVDKYSHPSEYLRLLNCRHAIGFELLMQLCRLQGHVTAR